MVKFAKLNFVKKLSINQIAGLFIFSVTVGFFVSFFSVDSYAKQMPNKKRIIRPKTSLSAIEFISAESGYQLKGDSCETIYKEINQFDQLYVKYDRPEAYIKPVCIESMRTVSIEGLIPERMLSLLKQKPQYFGPNCWNSVLYVNQATDHIRFVQPDEFQRSLPFLGCYKKDLKDLATGDIVRINDKKSEEQHAFVYISENLSFTKNGPETKASYQIVSTESILKNYDVDSECLLPEHSKSEKCLAQVFIYSCDMGIVSQQRYKFSNDEMNMKISDVEKRLEYIIINYRNPQFNQQHKYILLRELLQDSKTLKFIVDKELNQTDVFSYKFFLYKHYQTRLLSINEQIGYF